MERSEGRFNYPRRVGMKFNKDNPRQRSRTVQSFAKDANVNEIIRKYKKTGQVPMPFSTGGASPMYGDFSSGMDFNAAQNIIAAANSAFNALPASVRSRFHNDPSFLFNFVNDPANKDECIELGLFPAEKPPITLPNGNDALPGSGSNDKPEQPPAVGPTS